MNKNWGVNAVICGCLICIYVGVMAAVSLFTVYFLGI